MWWYPMFESNDESCINPSIFSRISCILGIRNSFIQIIWFGFLKQYKNMTVPFFFGWIKVGYTHSDLFTFSSNPHWKILYFYFLKKAFYDLGTGCSFAWYVLAPGCSFTSTGFSLQLPSFFSKTKFYLLNIPWSIAWRSSVDFSFWHNLTQIRFFVARV